MEETVDIKETPRRRGRPRKTGVPDMPFLPPVPPKRDGVCMGHDRDIKVNGVVAEAPKTLSELVKKLFEYTGTHTLRLTGDSVSLEMHKD
jgi:hypothetical protein